MRPGRRLATVLIALLASACGASPSPTPTEVVVPSPEPLGAFPAHVAEALRTDPDIVYTDATECGGNPCVVPGDVIAPAEGSGHPTVVLFHGGGMTFDRRRYQQDLAVALAERGAVVFLVSYRSAATGDYDSDALDDARCAVRFARATTAEYGGDPDRLIAMGHSMGAFLSLQLALQPEEETDHCLAEGSSKPDAVIGLGAPRPSLYGAETTAPPIWLFTGSEDPIGLGSAGILQDRGYEVRETVFEGVDHDEITQPSEVPEIVDLIVEALDAIRSGA